MKITPVEFRIRVLKEADAEDRNTFAAEVVALAGPSATAEMSVDEAPPARSRSMGGCSRRRSRVR